MSEITSTVSTEIEISSREEYDDGIPKIRTIDFGFYAVPLTDDIDRFITSVDNELLAKHEHYTIPAYISSESYVPVYESKFQDGVETSVLARLSGVNSLYEPVDNWCTLAPYVDKIKWRIDAQSD